MRVLICPKCGKDMYPSLKKRSFICEDCDEEVTMVMLECYPEKFRFEEKEDLKK